MPLIHPRSHDGTFNNNVLAIAAGVAASDDANTIQELTRGVSQSLICRRMSRKTDHMEETHESLSRA